MLRELADAVRTRRVSARELVERCLSRIERLDLYRVHRFFEKRLRLLPAHRRKTIEKPVERFA